MNIESASSHALIFRQWVLDESQQKELQRYQQKICDQLDWIELDPHKLADILEPLLSMEILENNVLYLSKGMIRAYYLLRSQTSIRISDQQLIQSLFSTLQHHIQSYLAKTKQFQLLHAAQQNCFGLKPQQKLMKVMLSANEK